MIVGFPAGNASDIVARVVAQALSDRLGQQFVVENRPGATGTLATGVVVKAAPDGYTLLMEVVTASVLSSAFYSNLNYNFMRDITPIARLGEGAYVMVVNSSVPADSLPQFIAYAKANPGKINMASAGSGTCAGALGPLSVIRDVCCVGAKSAAPPKLTVKADIPAQLFGAHSRH
jgi:tripartite-type tricarboxylate transporter receptor subunit TctC